MRPKEIAELLRIAVENERQCKASGSRKDALPPILIFGPPGVGKSMLTRGIAAEFGWNEDRKESTFGFRDYRLSYKDPSDLAGTCFPIRDKLDPRKGKTVWFPPSELPHEEDEEEGIFFLDELLCAPPLVQNAGLQFCLDRTIGSYHLKDGWIIVSASNKEGHGAFVHKLSSALANRFAQVQFDVHVDDWMDWAIGENLEPDILGFLSFRPELLHHLVLEKKEDAFPSPRSWHFLSSWMKTGLSESRLQAVSIGLVGEGATAELFAFRKLKNKLPKMDDILAGKIIPFPTSSDLKYALVTGLAMKVSKPAEMEALISYTDTIEKAGDAEFSVLMIKLLAAKNSDMLVKAPSWKKWVSKNKSLFYQ